MLKVGSADLDRRKKCGMGHGSAPSGSLDVVDIDRNEHIVAKRQVVLADPVDTALGRIDETVEFAGLERIVGARRASEHAHDQIGRASRRESVCKYVYISVVD